MSAFSDQLSAAATEAQRILAPMVDPDDDGTFTLAGFTDALTGLANLTGVLNLRSYDLDIGANGVERVEELAIVATADQFAAVPSATPRLAVTAIGRSWFLTKVDSLGASYALTCVPA